MPTYVYKFVDTGETIEVQQAFTDDTLTEAAHPESGEVLPVKKVFQPVGVTFRGSGFFKTDNRGSKSTSSGQKPDNKSNADGGTSSDSSKSGDSSSSGTTSGTKTSESSTPSSGSTAGSSSD